MKRIDEFRKNAYRDFVPLKEVVPLSTPFSMLIDPSSVCNFRCKFCPTGHPELMEKEGRKTGLMKPELFRKIIDDLTGFPDPVRKLNLYKLGEPLLNKYLESFIAYTKEKRVADIISVTTNASLLNEQRAVGLIEAGLDHIRISVEHVSDQGYKEVTNVYSDYDRILRNTSFLWNERIRRGSNISVSVKIVDSGLTKKDIEKFYNDFSSISNTINVESLMGWDGTNSFDFRLGKRSDKGIDNISPIKKDRQVCPQPFFTLAIHYNGMASPCPVDWRMILPLGDANVDNVVDIWNGTKLFDLRMMHLRSKRFDLDPCGSCPSVEGDRLHADLDSSADWLIQEYSKQNTVPIK